MSDFIYGRWPVLETLRAGRRQFQQVLIADGTEEKNIITDIINTAQAKGVEVRRVPRRIVDDLATHEGNHQGVVLRTGGYPYVELEDIFEVANQRDEKPFILLLDLLKDPQNVGVLLRVADAVGVHGVIMQVKRSVAVTPAVVAASSGAVEHLRVSQVTNLVNTMKKLQEENVWLVGLDIGPNVKPLDKVDLDMSLGLVLGSEGEGLRRLVRETCDLLVTLPMRGAVESLNVATVGAVAVYAAWQARGWQGWNQPQVTE
ncbi:MAG: 23S rRNA (guanosine(2251)-2'-O)-methyltransferase RlmB [Chloroflexota bacterium]|nr:23S rRNA (guanosine(2251)-2'-O)-methyltransferase RlmB [Chloroflexota bacterium]NOG66097.1 23S rRNA (guanosine(2251)-2'-O)-methyltransferase RlmB [Chloroflexota bacterium]GIK63907.1 MAG: 23S rRNA (guanosine(2251)-2'-O)-methyltransferase RlmB [Chloroflexota bacterium]